MCSIEESRKPPKAIEAPPSRPGLTLPWTWTDGTRVLLAVLAITAAIGLMIGRQGRPASAGPSAGPVVSASELKLDPNTASPEALATLPHIGPTLARRIAEARADGPFRSPEDLRDRVRGIGPATLAQIAPYLRIDDIRDVRPRIDPSPIAIVDSSADPGGPRATSPGKPSRSKKRKAKGPSVQLAAKAGETESP